MKLKPTIIILLIMAIAGCGESDDSSSPSPIPSPNPVPMPEPEPEPEIEDYANLRWSAPLTRQDGTSISMGELSHYVVSYGTDESALTNVIQIDNASEKPNASIRIEDLSHGTWFFGVQVVDTEDRKSPMSDIVSKTITVEI